MNIMIECLTPLSLAKNAWQTNPQCLEIYQTAMSVDGGGFAEYLSVFLLTCGLEFMVYFLFLIRESSLKRAIIVVFLLNLATHPIIYLGLPPLAEKFDLTYLQYLLAAETFAPVVEAICLKKFFYTSWKTAIWAAILANLFSWTVGIYWYA